MILSMFSDIKENCIKQMGLINDLMNEFDMYELPSECKELIAKLNELNLETLENVTELNEIYNEL